MFFVFLNYKVTDLKFLIFLLLKIKSKKRKSKNPNQISFFFFIFKDFLGLSQPPIFPLV